MAGPIKGKAPPTPDGYSVPFASSVILRVLCLFAMEATPGTRKKRNVFTALFVLALGILPLLNSLHNPHLAGLRGPDVLRLIAIGFCVGTAFGMLVGGRASS